MRRGAFTRALEQIVAAAEWLAVALLVAMVVVVLLGVLYRYALDRSLVWYDEFASYILVWLTFVGAVAASWRGRQISFDLIIERSGPKVARLLRVFAELCVLTFHLLITYYGWNLMDRMGEETAVSILSVKMSWIYGVLPASATLMALISLHRLISLARGDMAPPEGGVPSTGSSSE
jgi:TRAP-type C4-dicarboxylate transport system permease small subunit